MLFFPDCSAEILGAPGLVAVGAPRLVTGALRCSQVLPGMLSALPDFVPALPVTLKATKNAYLGSDTPLKLMHLSLHSTSSQTLLDTSSDKNPFRWCRWWLSPSLLSISLHLYIHREINLIHVIVRYGKSSDCNKDKYDRWNASCLQNPHVRGFPATEIMVLVIV